MYQSTPARALTHTNSMNASARTSTGIADMDFIGLYPDPIKDTRDRRGLNLCRSQRIDGVVLDLDIRETGLLCTAGCKGFHWPQPVRPATSIPSASALLSWALPPLDNHRSECPSRPAGYLRFRMPDAIGALAGIAGARPLAVGRLSHGKHVVPQHHRRGRSRMWTSSTPLRTAVSESGF